MAERKKAVKKERVACPYCDAEIFAASFPYCTECHVRIIYCPDCKKPIPRASTKCPSCGAAVKAKA